MSNFTLRPTVTINPLSVESLSSSVSIAIPSSAVWPSANRAVYVPFRLWSPITALKMWWVNGATVSGNVDTGIYSIDGTKLVTMGSTAQGTLNLYQEVDIADTKLGVGLFFMALAMDNGTGTMFRSNPSVPVLKSCRVYQQASAFPLPATATFATAASAFLPLFGLRI